MLSGDKEKVKEYATKMTYNELSEAMNKVDLMQKLNYEPPKPTTMDKINNAIKKVDTARDWMEKSLKAYDALAAINNTFNKDSQWPRAQLNKSGDKKDDKKDKETGLEKMAKKITSDAQNAKAENDRRLEVKLEKKDTKLADNKNNDQQKAAKEENRESKKQDKDDLKITFNKYNVNVDPALSKKVDDRLTANENEMFEKISSGNFDWDNYDIRKHTQS